MEEIMEKSMLRVGVCLAESKKGKMKLPISIFDPCRANGIEIIDINLDLPLEEQGPFDIILHKILEFRGEDKTKGQIYEEKFIRYINDHDEVKILDPVSTCEILTNRFRTMEAVRNCEFTSSSVEKRVFVPKFCYVDFQASDLKAIKKSISSSEISYPIIMKHFMGASFGKVAHEMSIIFSENGLCDVKTPCFLQQFHNHDGFMLKIYTVGAKYYVCKRPSIKDLMPGEYQTIHFNSGNVSKRGRDSFLHNSAAQKNICNNDPTLIEEEIVRELLQRLKSEFEFTLLGIDLIVDKETGDYGIIDINYFPGYDGVKDLFPLDLVELLKSARDELLVK